MHSVQYPKLTARASMRARPTRDPLIPPGSPEARDLALLSALEFAVAALIVVVGFPCGFFVGQAVVTAIGKVAGL